jgi:hypothetical protein
LYISGTNIFMPVTLGITESGNLDITWGKINVRFTKKRHTIFG